MRLNKINVRVFILISWKRVGWWGWGGFCLVSECFWIWVFWWYFSSGLDSANGLSGGL